MIISTGFTNISGFGNLLSEDLRQTSLTWEKNLQPVIFRSWIHKESILCLCFTHFFNYLCLSVIISKNVPHWTFWHAILWMKNAARNKQIYEIKLRKQSFSQNRKRQNQKWFLKRVSKCPVRKVFRYIIWSNVE